MEDEMKKNDKVITKTDMTVKEALMTGFKATECTWYRGYVSRKCIQEDQPIYYNRVTKRYFAHLPSWTSTTYCYRQYYKAPISTRTLQEEVTP